MDPPDDKKPPRFHFFHRWSRWQRIQVNIVNADPPYSLSGLVRTCETCGKRKVDY